MIANLNLEFALLQRAASITAKKKCRNGLPNQQLKFSLS